MAVESTPWVMRIRLRGVGRVEIAEMKDKTERHHHE
jgi:hypothetical protein